MSHELTFIFSFSVIIATVIGWIRIRKIGPTYYPFLLCITLAAINEAISYYYIDIRHQSNAVNANLYVLAESLLLLWQFRNWKTFDYHKKIFWLIAIVFLASWTADNFILGKINHFRSYFRVIYSFILVLLSINCVNHLITDDRKSLLTNPVFVICSGMIIYYTYKVLVEVFWIYGIAGNNQFTTKLYDIHTIINLISNLVYAWAILWMQKRQRFLLPS
jgi:hypothetical protein